MGTIEAAYLRIGEQRVRLFDSPVEHDFAFTPAVSLFVELDTDEEVNTAFATLSEGGAVLVPLASYPFSERFAWINDRFGVSWQLSVKALRRVSLRHGKGPLAGPPVSEGRTTSDTDVAGSSVLKL